MNCRRTPCLVALAAVLTLASLYGFVSLSRTTQAAPAPNAEASLRGKVVLVSMNNMSVYLLEKVQLQKLGEQSCLVGKGAADGRMTGWYKGRTVWLRMENVIAITEFDDLKSAQKALESGGGSPWGGYAVPAAMEAVPAAIAPPAAPVPVDLPKKP